MAEIVSSDAASGRSPKARWHIMYVTPASFTCPLNASRTVETDPTKQCPSSKACLNGAGTLGGSGKPRLRERCVGMALTNADMLEWRGHLLQRQCVRRRWCAPYPA